MFSAPTKKELTVPLLGTEQQDEDMQLIKIVSSSDSQDDDEESCETGCTVTCTFHSDDDDEETVSSCLCENWIIWFVLPVLLFLQFGMAFTVAQQRNLDQISRLDWSTVNYSIVLFMMGSYLYRKAMNSNDGCDSVILQLLPEIAMDIVLALVLLNHVVAGFLFMVCTTSVMALYSATTSCRLFVNFESEEDLTSRTESRNNKQ